MGNHDSNNGPDSVVNVPTNKELWENLFEKVEAGDYLTITAPAGYTVKEPVVDENNKVYFEGGETEVTVILTKVG